MYRKIASIVTTAALVLVHTSSSGQSQDAKRGEHVFRKCLLCHVTNPNAKDLVAPPLHNIVGRRAAIVPGFDYSDIMKVAGREGLVWTTEALFYFLDRPEEFMPGTYMAFSGLEEQERKDIIAYLDRLTADWKRSEARAGRASPVLGAKTPPSQPAAKSTAPAKPVPATPPR